MFKPRLSVAFGLLLATPFALAASPVGTWTGKIVSKMPALPANATPQQKSMMTQIMGQMAKARFTLSVKADKTFTVMMTGTTMGAAQKPESGKWSQKGNVVTTTTVRPTGAPHVQDLTLSADGKTMTLVAPGGRGKVVFTR